MTKMTGVLIEDPDQFDMTVISYASAHKDILKLASLQYETNQRFY